MNKLYFTTLFNSTYLCKGLAMCDSLDNVCSDYCIYIFAYDEVSYKFLLSKKNKNAIILSLEKLEEYFPELLHIKSERSFAEYCWTTTSYTILYCLENFKINHCTYIDADLYFFSNPIILFEELKHGDVLITKHRYTTQYDQSKTSGIYCVQFMTFKQNDNSLSVLKWWKNKCYQWCYNKYEDGKFGDQKYLDDWPERFNNIVILKNLGGGVAPWNVQQYNVLYKKNVVYAINKKSGEKFDIVFYHFHYFRYTKLLFLYEYVLGPYLLDNNVINYIYNPYRKKISEFHRQLLEAGFMDSNIGYEGMKISKFRAITHLLKNIFKRDKIISFK